MEESTGQVRATLPISCSVFQGLPSDILVLACLLTHLQHIGTSHSPLKMCLSTVSERRHKISQHELLLRRETCGGRTEVGGRIFTFCSCGILNYVKNRLDWGLTNYRPQSKRGPLPASSFTGAHPQSSAHIMSMAALVFQLQFSTCQGMRPTKPNIFTI